MPRLCEQITALLNNPVYPGTPPLASRKTHKAATVGRDAIVVKCAINGRGFMEKGFTV
jgi:hypothetical protein